MKVSTALDHIDSGSMTLPEFQRGYVWNSTQVRGLMQSLYRQYPVGGLLIWTTRVDASMRRDETVSSDTVKLLLDGQQRITSLYGVMRGHAPAFFQGNEKAFTDLYFNVRDETFEFYGPIKMRDDPFWINVTDLYQKGPEPVIQRLPPDGHDMAATMAKLFRLLAIRDRELFVEEITGADQTIDEVVEIFNRVNSGGTKLSKGDLALARVSADRPAARNELREMLAKWNAAGFDFSLDWLLRVVTTIATRQSQFSALRDVDADTFGESIEKARKAVNYLLNLISDRLGLDHDRVLGGRYAFAAMAPLVTDMGGMIEDVKTQNDLLFWYIHSFMWGRYSGSTESILQRDLEVMSQEGVQGLIDEMDRWRGSMEVRPGDFMTSSVGSRFYPVLYMLSRVREARDLSTGINLKANLLGKESALHVHHLFPKKRLYDAEYSRSDVNALANFAFLTASSNLSVGATPPAEYFPELEEKNPGVLASQWIPMEPDLWQVDNYLDFMTAREELMAKATNRFLAELRSGDQVAPSVDADEAAVAVVTDYEEDEPELERIVRLASELGLAAPELHYEIVEPESGEMLAFADLVWPEGVQPELSEPVAFLLEPDREMEERLNELGYRFFTETEKLVWYLEDLVGVDIDGDGETGEPFTADDDEDSETGGQWDRTSFLAYLEKQRGPREADAARRILDWCQDAGLDINWGKGTRNGSASPKLNHEGRTYNLMTVWTDGAIQIQFSSMYHPPFNDFDKRMEFARVLDDIDAAFDMSEKLYLSDWPALRLHQLVDPDRVADFIDAWEWYLREVRAQDQSQSEAGSETDDTDLEVVFHGAMARIYTRAKSEAGYNATRYLQMVSENGGLATAKQLLHSSDVSDGFTHLWEKRRLDLSVEALVLQPQWRSLFTDEDLRIARERLEAYGYPSS